MHCITEHPGFRSNCLDVWVLKTAYYAFRQQHGADNRTGHEFVYFVHLSHYLSLWTAYCKITKLIGDRTVISYIFLLSLVGNFVTLPTDNSFVGFWAISVEM